ncbi:MAG: DASS family sodium-coupled anion symporter [Acidobacteria bacterium]|nr:DASS family sodium-coupled anion symporter [Acidobacteriota bacterium]
MKKWLIVLACGFGIALFPAPEGVAPKSWTLLAIFIATIVGSIVQPLSGSAMVLVGVIATVVFGVLEPKEALKGYAEPVVWLVLAAFFLSVGMIKTGLGRRISLLFVRAMGRKTIGLGYALVSTDFILASMVPSNGARNGGVILPIAQSVCETYDSRPGDGTAGKLGTFLMTLLYQCDVIICATFITGQASNLIIAKLAKETSGVELTYTGWLFAAIVPALVSLAVVPFLIYRMTPPEIKETPEASKFAQEELTKMGPVTRGEIIMLSVLVGVVLLWITKDSFHKLDTGIVALLGICVLLFAKIIEWKDLMGETNAWSVFIWYGGLVNMATVLGETGLTKIFAEKMGVMTAGFSWVAALAILAFVYFYSHYFFASITAHVLAMFAPFLAVTIIAGAPAGLTVLLLAYFSNLNAGLTHFGTTPAPIYFGLGYVKQRTWWIIGLVVSVVNIAIWSTIGVLWWKIIGRF